MLLRHPRKVEKLVTHREKKDSNERKSFYIEVIEEYDQKEGLEKEKYKQNIKNEETLYEDANNDEVHKKYNFGEHPASTYDFLQLLWDLSLFDRP